MNDKYQLYPRTIKALATELVHVIDDYCEKKIEGEQLMNIIVHWNDTSGHNILVGPNQYNSTITQRLGKKRLHLLKSMLSGRVQISKNPFIKQSFIIMVGLPLSGKSTLAKKCASYAPKIVIVCPDTIRLALHGEQFKKSEEPYVWKIVDLMVRTLLKDEFTVILDATNISRVTRNKWSKVAQEFGLDFMIFYVDTPYDICRARNKELQRLNEGDIKRMEKKYEPPNNNEGYIYTFQDVHDFLSTH